MTFEEWYDRYEIEDYDLTEEQDSELFGIWEHWQSGAQMTQAHATTWTWLTNEWSPPFAYITEE